MARKNTLRGNALVCMGDAALTFPRSSDYRLAHKKLKDVAKKEDSLK
ncbi:MAG: hypothetical protein ISR77_11400 [Pirellulaceae bacterium]|nr:hypothetical protein [Pirellulaceae bacterium]